MNKTFTLEQVINFSDAEVDQFIDDFIKYGDHRHSPSRGVIHNILSFSLTYYIPFPSESFPGVINN